MNFANTLELSQALSQGLVRNGQHCGDRFELAMHNPEYGNVKLNDYFNVMHVKFERPHHFRFPLEFYELENIVPILSIESIGGNGEDFSVQIFKPCDVKNLGIGTLVLRGLDESTHSSTEIIIKNRDGVLSDPLRNRKLMNLFSVILEKVE